MSQKTRNPKKGNRPVAVPPAGDRAKKFDQLFDSWKQEVVIPDDPGFADNVLAQIRKNAVRTPPVRQQLAWTSVAALLAVTAGLGLGLLLHNNPATISAENELYTAANELNINTIISNPYDYLITEPTE